MPSIPVIAMASISFYVGIYHLLIYLRRRQFREHLTFSLLCFTVVLYDAACVGLYNANSVMEGAQWQKMQFISLSMFVPAFLWFVAVYTNQKPGLVIYACSLFYFIAFLVQLIDRSDLTFLSAEPSIKIVTLAGFTVTYYEVILGPFSFVQSVIGPVASAYILVMGFRFYKRGHKREAIPLILATGLMYAAGIHDTLVSNGVYPFIYLMEYAYLATILMMTSSLSGTVVEAAIAKEELKKSEEWFRSLVETTSDWVWEVDTYGRYTYASPRVRDLLGYEPEDVLGHTPFDFMPSEEAQSVGKTFLTIIQNRGVLERLENSNLDKNGQLVVLETSAIPFFNEQGELLGYRGIDRDITERKKSENALKESEEKFRSIVENSLTGIFKVDNSYHFVYVNNELCRILGYPRDQLLGLDFRQVLSQSSREVVADRYIQRLRGEDVPSRYDLDVVRFDGELRHAEMIVTVLNDVSGSLSTMGQLVDITERKQAEEALRQSQQMLRTVLDQFPGVVYWKDRQSVYLGCNQASATAAGLSSPEEIIGKTDFDLPWAKTEAMAYRADDKAVMESGQPRFEIIEPQHRAYGSLSWLDTAKVPLMDEKGNVIGILGTSRDITEQVRTLHALQETEFFLNRSQQVARIGSYKLDLQSGAWESSPSMDDILGVEDAFPKNVDGWLSLVIPEDREMMRDHLLRNVLAERQRFEKEYRIIHPHDGQLRWMYGLGELEFDDAGEPIRMIGTIQDITERKMAEAALQQATLIVENSPVMLFRWQAAEGWPVVLVSQNITQFGYVPEEFLSGSVKFVSIVHAEDLGRVVQEVRDYTASGVDRFLQEYRIITKDGQVRWVEDRTLVERDTRGLATHYQGIVVDITDRKRAEEALRTSEERLQQAIRISDIGIFDHDHIADTIYWSPDVRKNYGISPNETYTLSDFVSQLHPDDLERIGLAIQRAHDPAGDGSFDVEYRFIRHDGTIRWFTAKSKTYFASEGSTKRPVRTIGALIDITERKQTEEEREKLIRELEAKNAELERFTYTVSHDLKSPLVTIKGFLGFLKQDFTSQNSERFISDVERIENATAKMDLLLRDLLELSRIGRLINPSEEIPFETIIQEAMEMVHGQLDMRGVTVHIEKDLPAVYVDRRRMVEVLQNLLDNATKFMGDQTDPRIEIGQTGNDGKTPIFYVKDNGIGFAPEYRELVFGLFNKLDPKSEGSGIGLALVKRIIEMHGGRIWVESEKGKGSTFYFTLAKNVQMPR